MRGARLVFFLGFLLSVVLGLSLLAYAVVGASAMQAVAKWLALGALLVLLLALAWRLGRVLLWRVGRRLALSYFLIGVLPIPMVALLVLLNAYLLAGYFLGHLHGDARAGLERDLRTAAEAPLTAGTVAASPLSAGEVEIAVYRDGRRVGGSQRLPEAWPGWLAADAAAGEAPGFVTLEEGSPTLAAAAGDARRGAVALYAGDLEWELSRRSGVWTRLFRPDDPGRKGQVRLQVLSKSFALQPLLPPREVEDRSRLFGELGEDASWFDRPSIWWGVISGPLVALDDGQPMADFLSVSLNGAPRTVGRSLFSGQAEINTAAWAGLISMTGLLATLYALAVGMALVMIFTLSRAVNRLSSATARLSRGDFRTRIPVRRADQVGELQRSFNEMAERLERSVADAAQREALEKELAVARELQKSLLPRRLPAARSLEFATLFEPSAAIGGDYFDVLRADRERLAVVIADVAGHGLPAGLQMAMLKAGLVMLVEEAKPATEILARLSRLARASGQKRFLVTATLGLVDFRRGELKLTNAGHPPTYLLRDGEAEEILLPGNPLGALGTDFGERPVALAAGDVVVWLSDGLIEAADPAGEPFGYERVLEALAGAAESAAAVRDRLVAAVDRHAAGRPPADDRTLVAMRYQGPAAGA